LKLPFFNMGQISSYQYFQLTRLVAAVLISIFLVKSGYDAFSVSNYERFIFLANLFSFFWVMGIKNAALSFYPKITARFKESFFYNVFLLLQCLGVVFAGLLMLTGPSKLLGLEHFNTFNDRLILGLYLIFYAPTVLLEVIFILQKKASLFITYGSVIHVSQIVLIGIAAWNEASVLTMFKLLLMWTILKWIITVFYVIKNSLPRFQLNLTLKYIWFALPVILHILLGNGMEFIDGILVNRFFDPDQFAVFRYGARELPFILIMVGALSSSVIPLAVNQLSVAKETLRTNTKKLMHLFYPIAIITMFLSPLLFKFFYSSVYLNSAILFNIYLLILASRIILPEVFIYGKHENRILMYTSFGELILNLLLSIVLINDFGLNGIAMATVIAYFLSKLFFVAYVWKKHGINPTAYFPVPLYLLYTASLFISFTISTIL